MIDYEKLKLAHELAEECDMQIWFTASSRKDYGATAIMDIDDLIAKITELTQPKPKYKDAWYLSDNGKLPLCTKVHAGAYYAMCDETDIGALGKTMYPSKEALIDAQIEYWQSLKSKDAASLYAAGVKKIYADAECQHESEEIGYTSNPPQNRCKKCGEFYRC